MRRGGKIKKKEGGWIEKEGKKKKKVLKKEVVELIRNEYANEGCERGGK